MAKKKTMKKRGQSKKDLERKIKQLEAKVAAISAKTKPAETKTPPPPPKPAETKTPPPSPKPAETKTPPPSPKPAETKTPPQPPKPAEKAAPPVTLSESLENAWQNYPMTNTFDYKKKTPGYTPNPNRYFGRLIATVGTTQTYDWNLQKAKVPGYTAPSNQYFATRARLSYHPADTNFTGYGLQVEGATAQTQTAPTPPPPPQPEPQPQQTTANTGGSSRKSELEKYEEDYLARLEHGHIEQEHIQRAAEELAAKRAAESGGSSGQSGSKKGALPKGF